MSDDLTPDTITAHTSYLSTLTGAGSAWANEVVLVDGDRRVTLTGKDGGVSIDVETDAEVWFCEGCDEKHEGTPAAVETYPGAEGDVELWFCEECARRDRAGLR